MSYPFGKGKKVSAQAPRDRYTRSRSSARTTWRDPRSAPGDSIDILLTSLRTEGMYNNEDATVEARNIANFGWNIEGSAITPTVSTAPVAPQTLLDVVSCSCTAECKACSAHAAAATAQAFHARTTANTREETSAVVLSSASRWISKTSVDDE